MNEKMFEEIMKQIFNDEKESEIGEKKEIEVNNLGSFLSSGSLIVESVVNQLIEMTEPGFSKMGLCIILIKNGKIDKHTATISADLKPTRENVDKALREYCKALGIEEEGEI